MTERHLPAPLTWRSCVAFFLGDALMIAAAWLIFQQASRPMVVYEVCALAFCVFAGATLGILPFLLKHRADIAVFETTEFTAALDKIQNLEQIAERIANATSLWQTVQEHAGRTVNAARDIREKVTAEAKEFRAFLEKSQDTERSHLRLEVEKLRRGEGEWMQVVVRLLDNVYALYQAGVRSGQPHLVEQLGNYQAVSREITRRVGLLPLVAPPGAPVDPQLHELADPKSASEGCVVAETVATGYTYQGQIVRRALVTAQAPKQEPAAAPAEPAPSEPPGAVEPAPVPEAAAPAPQETPQAAQPDDREAMEQLGL